MIVEAPCAAADVGHARARAQLVLDAVERRDPRLHEVRAVARAEEALAALEQVVRVLVPADAGAAAERLGDLRLVAHGGGHQLEGAGQERGLSSSASATACSAGSV